MKGRELYYKGAGGSSSSQPKPPHEADDTLHSTQFATIIDLLSEGIIKGYADRNWNQIGLWSIYGMGVFFDQTSLMTDYGEWNFAGVDVWLLYGYPSQNAFPSFVNQTDTVNLGIELKQNQPYTIAIDDPSTTRLAIGIRIPRLEQQDKKGNVSGYSVSIQFWMSINGNAMFPFGDPFSIDGKCSSDYVREFNIWLPKTGLNTDFWQVRVQRSSPDDADSKHSSETIIDYFTRSVDANLTYPNSACAGVTIDASQLSNIPTRTYRVKGKHIWIPSNYFPEKIGAQLARQPYYNGNYACYTRDPVTGNDTGVYQPWDGTFYLAWSNNPAWVFYDMCTNSRYGAGEYLGTNIDKWTLYYIGLYCDELVPDGYGHWEKRFTCNTYFQSQGQAWKVLSDLASVFRGMIYWGQGTVIPVQDGPKPVMQSFTNANVVDARFSYTSTELKNRQSDAAVQWNDREDFFKQKTEPVFDQLTRTKYGYRVAKFTAFGCSSRGQAWRAGRYFIVTNRYETETIMFQTGLDAMYLKPGDVIGIMDNDRVGLRKGGRIKSIDADRHWVTLDRYMQMPDSTQIFLYATKDALGFEDAYADSTAAFSMHPPMSWMGYIGGVNGQWTDRVYVYGSPTDATVPIPPGVVAGSIFVLGTPAYNPYEVPQELFRIVTIAEKETYVYQIEAVQYVEGKYDLVDFGIQFDMPQRTYLPGYSYVWTPPLSSYPTYPINFTRPHQISGTFGDLNYCPPVNNLQVSIQTHVRPEGLRVYILATWEPPADNRFREYQLSVQTPGASWGYEPETLMTNYLYETYSGPGTYGIRAYCVNIVGVRSIPVETSIYVPDAALLLPHKITGLEIQNQSNNTTYMIRNPVIQWRLNSPIRQREINSEEPYGASTGDYDPYFLDYEVTITDAETGITGWQIHTAQPNYQISEDQNANVWGDNQPRPHLLVTVKARNKYIGDEPVAVISIDNPVPEPPINVYAQTLNRVVTVTWETVWEPDLVKNKIYVSPTASATSAHQIAETSVNASSYTSAPMAPGAYYFFVAQVDNYGNTSPLSAASNRVLI